MEDGSHVAISIEYKPRSEIRGNDKFGSYYYIVQLRPHSPFDPKTDGIGRVINPEHAGYFTRIHISFYGRKGYSLFNNRGGDNTLAPGWNNNPDEVNKIDGGWKWVGRFAEEYITLENFRDIHAIKVTYAK